MLIVMHVAAVIVVVGILFILFLALGAMVESVWKESVIGAILFGVFLLAGYVLVLGFAWDMLVGAGVFG